MEIHTTGGGDFLFNTLNAIAVLVGSDNFSYVAAIAVTIGLIGLIFQVMFSGSLMEGVKMFVVISFMSALSLGHTSTVIILDKTKGPLWFRVVDNVPTSVAFAGNLTSVLSEGLTRRMETLFSTPTNVSYSETGMLFGATLIGKTTRWRAVTSSVHENLVNYFDQCVIDAVSLRYIQPEVMTTSGDLASTIASNLPNSLAYYDVETKSTRLCSEGWASVVAAAEGDIEKILAVQAASLFQVAPDTPGGGPAAIARLESSLVDVSNFSHVASGNSLQMIRQSMLIAALDDAASRGIAASTNTAALQHLQSARAEAQTRSSYQAIGSNALSWVPYMKIVFENLYYGAFPLALLLMFTPLGMTVLRGYFGGFVWLAAWEPLSAILHSILLESSAVRYRAITTTSTNGSLDSTVINWANHFGVYSVEQDVSAMAGYLMMSVPFVATALFFGANRMTGLATSILGPSQSAAGEAARETATGNYSYGNASVANASLRNYTADNLSQMNYARNNRSFDNISGNRTVTSSYSDVGRSTEFLPNGTVVNRNSDGSTNFDRGSSASTTNTNVAVGQSVVGTLRNTATAHAQRGDEYRRAAAETITDLTSQSSAFMQAVQNGSVYSEGSGSNTSEEQRNSVNESIATIDKFAESNNISRQTALEISAYAQAGVKAPVPWADLNAGVRTSLSRRGVSEDSYNQLTETARNSNVSEAFNTLQSGFQSLSQQEHASLNTTQDYSNRATIDDARRLENNAAVHESASEAYSEAADRAENKFVNHGVDLGSAFTHFLLKEKGYTEHQAAEILQGGREVFQLNRDLREEFAQNYIADIIDPQMSAMIGQPVPPPIVPPSPVANTNVPGLGPGAFTGYAGTQQRVQTGIIQSGVNAAQRIQEWAIALDDKLIGAGDTYDAASGRSYASWAAERTSGSLVETPDGVRWQNPDGSIPQPATINGPGMIGNSGTVDRNGFFQADNVSYGFSARTIRDQPIDPTLMQNMSSVAASLGTGIGIHVTSGGQDASGPGHTGSARHNHGGAVDFVITQDGRQIKPADNPVLYANFIELAAQHHPGIGHYDWGIHVGGGSPAFWGPDKTAASADPYFRDAYQRGRGTP